MMKPDHEHVAGQTEPRKEPRERRSQQHAGDHFGHGFGWIFSASALRVVLAGGGERGEERGGNDPALKAAIALPKRLRLAGSLRQQADRAAGDKDEGDL